MKTEITDPRYSMTLNMKQEKHKEKNFKKYNQITENQQQRGNLLIR